MKCIKNKIILFVTIILSLNIAFSNNILAATNIQVGNRPSYVGKNGCTIEYKPLDYMDKGIEIIHAQDFYMAPQTAHNFANDLTPSRTQSLVEFLTGLITIPISGGLSTALGAYFWLDSDGDASLSNKIKDQIQKSYNDGNGGYIRVTVKFYEMKRGDVSMTTYDTADWNGGNISFLSGFSVKKIYRLN